MGGGTGASLIRGHGRLVAERTVEVEAEDGATRTLTARRGVVVGVEMAQAFRRLGAEVTVVEVADRLLATEEPFVGEHLRAAFVAEGISVHVDAEAVRVRRDGDGPVTLTLAQAVVRVVFTDPKVAAVGPTLAVAEERGLDVEALTSGIDDVAGAALLGEGVSGTAQLVVDRERRTIVGATFTGPAVGEMLRAATIAIVSGVTLEELWHAVPAFPTVSEVWLRLLEADRGIT